MPPTWTRAAGARLAPALLAAALLAPGAALGDSIRCPGGLVGTGDSKLDLLGKCGRPALVEERLEERARVRVEPGGRGSDERRATSTVERWTYNFGPRQFVRHVTLVFGRVETVEEGSYGYDLGAEPPPLVLQRARCEPSAVREGASSFDLLARCGEPAVRDLKVLTLTESEGDGAGGRSVTRTVSQELWTYDFGPLALVRRALLEEGRVVRVETGGYGYSVTP